MKTMMIHYLFDVFSLSYQLYYYLPDPDDEEDELLDELEPQLLLLLELFDGFEEEEEEDDVELPAVPLDYDEFVLELVVLVYELEEVFGQSR